MTRHESENLQGNPAGGEFGTLKPPEAGIKCWWLLFPAPKGTLLPTAAVPIKSSHPRLLPSGKEEEVTLSERSLLTSTVPQHQGSHKS